MMNNGSIINSLIMKSLRKQKQYQKEQLEHQDTWEFLRKWANVLIIRTFGLPELKI